MARRCRLASVDNDEQTRQDHATTLSPPLAVRPFYRDGRLHLIFESCQWKALSHYSVFLLRGHPRPPSITCERGIGSICWLTIFWHGYDNKIHDATSNGYPISSYSWRTKLVHNQHNHYCLTDNSRVYYIK
jgi:hypothetical protein